MHKIIIIGFILFLVPVLSVFTMTYAEWNRKLENTGLPSSYEVRQGATLVGVLADLSKIGLVHYPQFLTLYARIKNLTAIKAGEYRLSNDLTVGELINEFVLGNVITYPVTILEGWTFRQAISALHEQPKLSRKLEGKGLEEIAVLAGLGVDNPEGYFFPDTYLYTAGMSDSDILLQAVRKMEKVLENEWGKRDPGLPYKNAYEALIMASIVEKETGVASERPMIAGVFIRRLQKGMRLQTDPTVIYGLGEKFSGNLTSMHLREDTLYNTYVKPGLPPTPIALPGAESIHAALHPDKADYVYFVAKGDGSHQFSTTLAEHSAAVRKYQVLQRKKNYMSVPKK